MVFDWKNYLELAKALQKLSLSNVGVQEACHRAAVSRAYYAIFNVALDFAENENDIKYVKFLKEEAGKNHGELRKYYRQQNNIAYTKISKILGRMHNNRKDCDYENNISNTRSLMDETILLADDALVIIAK